MRVLALVLLSALVLLLSTLDVSGHILSKKILHYLLLREINPKNKSKYVVLPIVLPMPVGLLTKKIMHHHSTHHSSLLNSPLIRNHSPLGDILPYLLPQQTQQKNKAEVYIQATGDCTKGLQNCGLSAVLM